MALLTPAAGAGAATPPSHAAIDRAPALTADLAAGVRRQLAAGVQVAPKGVATKPGAPAAADPSRALVPDLTKVDLAGAKAAGAQRSKARAAAKSRDAAPARRSLAAPLLHDEREPAGVRGSNDTTATAELIRGFGTRTGKNPLVRILGQLSAEEVAVDALPPSVEDDGSIPLAADTGITASSRGVTTTGTIGDGPHGSAGDGSGDFDFYKLSGVPAGVQLTVDTDTPTSSFDSVVGVYDATGVLLAANDDEAFPNTDSLLRFRAPAAGDYYVLVSGFGFGTSFPGDPFDSGSGAGVGDEGPFTLTITAAEIDVDVYSFDLRPGDVIGASVTGAASLLTVHDSTGTEVFGSTQDASFIYPSQSPLPGGGNAVVDYVAPSAGRYTLAVSVGSGRYDVTLEAYRPGSELDPRGTVQTIFLDFDGARVNTAIYGGPGVRQLSPLAGFLGRWGLGADDERALIAAVVANVKENFIQDLTANGTNPRLAVRVLNSRQHADPFGQPNVTRIVVGGTIAESGIETIGIAQSIDPGNFGHEETGLVLLDAVSSPAGAPYSFNSFLTAESSRIAFIGQALGNVVTHELGHMAGNWHVDQFNDVPSIMDQGGNFPVLYGVGPDGIGGTADDIDVDFNADTLNPSEGFTGLEDTLNTTAWAYARGAA